MENKMEYNYYPQYLTTCLSFVIFLLPAFLLANKIILWGSYVQLDRAAIDSDVVYALLPYCGESLKVGYPPIKSSIFHLPLKQPACVRRNQSGISNHPPPHCDRSVIHQELGCLNSETTTLAWNWDPFRHQDLISILAYMHPVWDLNHWQWFGYMN